MSFTTKTAVHYAVPPILSGGIAYLGIKYGMGDNSQIDLFDRPYSTAGAIGIATAVGSLGTEFVGATILPYAPAVLQNSKMYEPLVTGALSAGVVKFGSQMAPLAGMGPLKVFGTSAVSDIVGRYGAENYVFPMIDSSL